MKQVPYDLYIRYERLDVFFNESTSRENNFLRCGLASLELSTFLLGSTLEKEKDDTAKVSDILKGIETQFGLLNLCSFPNDVEGYQDGYSESIEKLKLLDERHVGFIDRISKSYFDLSKKVNIGLDVQINSIRNQFGLPGLPIGNPGLSSKKELPNIIRILGIHEMEYFNSEDEIFMVIHQISECWFNIAVKELKSIEGLIENSEIYDTRVGHHFKVVFETLIYLADHIHLLEHMVLSDYHPLRVALRGASGGQSHQAHQLFYFSRAIFTKFLNLLENENKTIVQVLEDPKENIFTLSVVNHLAKLERSLKNFFFQHYILSSTVIGSQSFGSIGYDLVSLVDKFVEPIFKEIDQAKYDLTLKTNFQYGEFSGALVLEKESFTPHSDENHTTDNDKINSAINDYFDAISKFDKKKWVNLFAKDGYIEDPIGSRPYIGHQELSIFFKGVLRFFSKLNMAIESKRIEEKSATVVWKAVATTYNGKRIAFNGKEVFLISDEGEILAAQVHWDPSIIAKQL